MLNPLRRLIDRIRERRNAREALPENRTPIRNLNHYQLERKPRDLERRVRNPRRLSL